MRDDQDRGLISIRTYAVVAAAIIATTIAFAWENIADVPSNPGPSGIPESTVREQTPPPAGDLSGTTTGESR